MLTPQDVRSVQFEKNLRGYRTDEVDHFLDRVEEQLQQDETDAAALRKQLAELKAENEKLHKDLAQYEADGDMLKSAIINAQRIGENVIREANVKAEDIVHRANLRGDDIIRDANELLQQANDRADEIMNEAQDKTKAEEREYERVRLEVTRFKSDILNLYRSHVESLSRLPEYHKAEPEEAEAGAEAPAQIEEGAAEPETETIELPAPEVEPAGETAPEANETSEDFWAKDESQLKLETPPEPEKPSSPDYSAFQGVKFSE